MAPACAGQIWPPCSSYKYTSSVSSFCFTSNHCSANKFNVVKSADPHWKGEEPIEASFQRPTYLPIYLWTNLSLHVSTHLSTHPPIHPSSIYLSNHPPVYLSISSSTHVDRSINLQPLCRLDLLIQVSHFVHTHISIIVQYTAVPVHVHYLSMRLSVCLSVCRSACLPACPNTYLCNYISDDHSTIGTYKYHRYHSTRMRLRCLGPGVRLCTHRRAETWNSVGPGTCSTCQHHQPGTGRWSPSQQRVSKQRAL